MLNWTEKVVDLAALKPYEKNPRYISPASFEKLKLSLKENGYFQRILTNADHTVIGGHSRLRALQELGVEKVKILVPDRHLTPDEFRRILMQDNFSFGEFDQTAKPGKSSPDAIPDSAEPRTKLGDIWKMGDHRLMCGDCTNSESVSKLLNNSKPNLMVTDPPYGVSYDPTWRDEAGGKFGDGKTKMRGKVDNDDRADWSETFALFPGNIAYVWHGGLHSGVVAESLKSKGFLLRAQIIWVKPHFIMSRGDYHWMHEPCWYAVKNKGDWKSDRKQTTVWEIAGMNPAGRNRDEGNEKSSHGTQKPVECMQRPMLNNSGIGDVVYDPFIGSGTSIIAAEQIGRHCYGLELNPLYVDIAVKRWEDFTGKSAVME